MIQLLPNSKRKTFILLPLTLFLCLFIQTGWSQTWQPVGKPETTPGQLTMSNAVYFGTAKSPDGTPYFVMDDYISGNSDYRTTVRKYVNGNWVTVGVERFGDRPATNSKLAFAADGTPYVFNTNILDNQGALWKFNGTSWEMVSTNTLNNVTAPSRIIIDAGGVPYVLYREPSTPKTVVARLNGSTWETLGMLPVSSQFKESSDMAFDANGVLFVALRDVSTGGKASVFKLVGGTWQQVGQAGFTSGIINGIRIAFDINNIPCALSDVGGRPNLMKFENSTWQMHTADIAGASVSSIMDLGLDGSGTLFVAYSTNVTNNSKAVLKKYTGGQWLTVGSAGGLGVGNASDIGMVLTPGAPYLIYKDSGYASKPVMQKFNGSSWIPTVSFDEIESTYAPAVAIGKDGTLYAAFADIVGPGRISAKKFVNGSWQFIGQRGFSTSNPPKKMQLVADRNDNLYLCFVENSTSGGMSKTFVWRYDGTAWTSLGDPGSGQGFGSADIALDKDDVPYITFVDYPGSRLFVKKYNNGIWEQVGPVVSDASANAPSLTFDNNGILYAIYSDGGATSSRPTVKRLVNGAWELVGTRGFSSAQYPAFLDIAVNNAGVIYVSFATSSEVTVMRLVGGNWEQVAATFATTGASTYNSMAIDAVDGVHIAYKRWLDGKVMVSRFFNGSWRPAGGEVQSVLPTETVGLTYRNNLLALSQGFKGGFVKTLDVTNTVPVPANLQASIGDKKLSLQWDAVSQATGYRLYAMDAKGYSTLITETAGTQYEHTNLTNAATYRYRVAAIAGGVEGVFSSEISAVPFGGALNFYGTAVKTTAVGLSVASSDPAAQMSFSNDGISWSAWQAFATSKAWTLTSGEGLKTVFMKLKLNTVETDPYSVTIMLDQTQPVISGVTNGTYYNTDRTISFNEGSAVLTNLVTNTTVSVPLNYVVSTEGSYRLKVTDAAGNITQADFWIDKTAPAKATLTMPARNADGYTTVLKPTINGTGEVNSKVQIFLDGSTTALTEITVGSPGTWSYTFPSNLAEKTYSVKAVVIDRAGNVSPESDQFDFTVDQTAPAAPALSTMTGMVNSGYTNVSRPTVGGTAEPKSTVTLFLNGSATKLAEAVTGDDGKWSCQLTSDLPLGSNYFNVQAKDLAGNSSPKSTDFNFILDQTAPVTPTITNISGASPDNYSKDQRPVVKGKAEPDTKVRVFLDGTPEATEVTAGIDGNWIYTFTSDLAEGFHTIYVRSTDAAGNSTNSVITTLKIDITAPDAPVFIELSGLQNGYTNLNKPVLSGTKESWSTVTLYLDGVKVTDTYNSTLNWWYTFGSPIPEGPHKLTAVATDRAMNSSVKSAELDFIVDITAPAAPVVSSLSGMNNKGYTQQSKPTITGSAEKNATVSIFIGGSKMADVVSDGSWSYTFPAELQEGAYSVTVSAKDMAGNTGSLSPAFEFFVDGTTVKPEITSVSGVNSSGYTNQIRPVVKGTSEKNSVITMILDGSAHPITVTSDINGNWEYTFNSDLPEAAHKFTVKAKDPAGNEQESEEISFKIDATAPVQPGVPAIQGANNGHVNTTTPVIGGVTEQNATVEIYVDGNKVGEVKADGNGKWQYTFDPALNEGKHEITIKIKDEAGNASPVSDPIIIDVDTKTPGKPGAPQNNSPAGTASPTITGSTEPLATIEVYVDGNKVGEAKAGADGKWEYIFNPPLSEGKHVITIVVIDPAGNKSEAGEPLVIEVDIKVIDPAGEEIRVSKIVTPNGDGINDEIQIEGLNNAKEHRFVIYNRNGVRIFDSKTYPAGDAYIPHGRSFAGKLYHTGQLPGGTYFYTLEYKENGVPKLKRGYFVLKY